jgi:DNA-binding transcriptional LysR family regulator
MEFRHLRYFVAVAEELNFGRAAKRLRISQQPLSQQIKNLEEELGVKLFSRTTRRVELTEVGKTFLEETYRTLSQSEFATEAARRAARGETGILRIGHAPTALYNVLPEALKVFRARYPGVVLELFELISKPQEEALAAGRIEVGFLYPPVEDPGITTEVISEEPLMVVLPEEHRLADRDEVALEELAGEPFVMLPRRNRPALHDRIVGECRRAGFSPKVVQEANNLHTMLGLVAAGFGVNLTVANIRNLKRPGVVYRSLKDQTKIFAFAVAWRPEHKSSTLSNFLEIVREIAGSSAKQERQG